MKLRDLIHESTSSKASEDLMSLLKTNKPLLAFMKWKELLIGKYKIEPTKADNIMKQVYDKKGQVNINHLKQIANSNIKKL
jgi:hypothetical protein